jgi:hypothetical protein
VVVGLTGTHHDDPPPGHPGAAGSLTSRFGREPRWIHPLSHLPGLDPFCLPAPRYAWRPSKARVPFHREGPRTGSMTTA